MRLLRLFLNNVYTPLIREIASSSFMPHACYSTREKIGYQT